MFRVSYAYVMHGWYVSFHRLYRTLLKSPTYASICTKQAHIFIVKRPSHISHLTLKMSCTMTWANFTFAGMLSFKWTPPVHMVRVLYLGVGGYTSSRSLDSTLSQVDLHRDAGLGQIYTWALKGMSQRVK